MNLQINIKQLKEKIENMKGEMDEKNNDFVTHKDQKTEIRNELQGLITNCEQLYNEYDSARIQVSNWKIKFYELPFTDFLFYRFSRLEIIEKTNRLHRPRGKQIQAVVHGVLKLIPW